MASMRRWLVLVAIALLAGSCSIFSYAWSTPASVAAGNNFTMLVSGTTWGPGPAGAVFQVPNGFQVIGASARSFPQGGFWQAETVQRDDPALLALYTPDPNHYLASYSGSMAPLPYTPESVYAELTVTLQASLVPGAYQLEMALAGSTGSGWTPQLGLGSFQTPGGSVLRPLQVIAPPGPFSLIAVLPGVSPNDVFDLEGTDVDRDGRADLVLLGPSGLTVRRSIPGGFAAPGTTVPAAGSRDCALADFDGDGFMDVALSSGTVLFGDGGASWTPVVAATHGMTAAGVGAGDVDGDGYADVVFADAASIVVARGQANRTFVPWGQGLPAGAPSYAGEPQLVDLDADGRAELVASVPELLVAPLVYRSTVAGAWILVGTLPPNRRVLAIDVDGNGTKELLPSQGGQLFAYTPQGLVPAGATPVTVFGKAVALDFDRDGRTDIALGVPYSWPPVIWPPMMQLWRNQGSAFVAVPLPGGAGFTVASNFTQLVAADFDDDTFPDLAATHDAVLAWHNAQRGVAGYGEACAAPSIAAPDLSVQGSIAPGQSGVLRLANAVPSGITAMWLGSSRRLWNGQPVLPLELGFLGAPGCTLLAEPVVHFCVLVDPSGVASLPFTVPLFPAASQVTVFAQGAAYVPGANPLDALFTRGLALKIQ
jgi:hypothetical protein